MEWWAIHHTYLYLLQLERSDSAKSKGVSFSIKQKEPEVSSIDTSRVALPVDPESDDESANKGKV